MFKITLQINRRSKMKKMLAVLLGLSVCASFYESPVQAQQSDAAFAQVQLDLVNQERDRRNNSNDRPDPCADQFLTATTHYYDWIANYEQQAKKLYELFDNAAFVVDSFILSNTNIPGFTYQKFANGPQVNLTYADFRDYLNWTHVYAANAPDPDVLNTNLEEPTNNKWRLTFSKVNDVVAELQEQLNQCDGEECVKIGLTVKLDPKKGVMLHTVFDASNLTNLFREHLLTLKQRNQLQELTETSAFGDAPRPLSPYRLEYDLSEFIEQQKPFEEVLKTAIGDLNQSYVKVAYAEPMRWNYFVDTFVSKWCSGDSHVTNDTAMTMPYSYYYLRDGIREYIGEFKNVAQANDVARVEFMNRDDVNIAYHCTAGDLYSPVNISCKLVTANLPYFVCDNACNYLGHGGPSSKVSLSLMDGKLELVIQHAETKETRIFARSPQAQVSVNK